MAEEYPKKFKETFNNINELSIEYLRMFKDMQVILKKTCMMYMH